MNGLKKDSPQLFKLGHLEAGQWVEHSHPALFRLPESAEEPQRLIAGVPGGDPDVFLRLVRVLEPPYFLLYVLHTPRGEGSAGRYQSPQLDLPEFQAFISQFHQFLSQDARFDLWAHSPAAHATVVWDRHNRVFAYGLLSRFATALRSMGFTLGTPEVPTPHQHHYHVELDLQAKQLLSAIEWSFSPLRPEDEQ